jgi:hypothetical protein
MPRGIERKPAVAARLGCGVTTLEEKYVDRGGDPFVPGTGDAVRRIRPVAIGERLTGFFSDEVDRLIEEIRAWRDSAAHTLPKRPVPPEFHPSRHRRGEANERERLSAKRQQGDDEVAA